jgi:hypothetical protein
MPALDSVQLHGACTGSMKGFKHANQFKAEVHGASSLSGDIDADTVELAAHGASQFTLKGKADECEAEAQGASTLHLRDLKVERAVVQLHGASNGSVNATKSLDFDISGASHLDYKGNPQIGKQQTSGASSATAR